MAQEISSETRIFELEDKLEKSYLNLHDLATVGTLITSILDLETVLSVVMEMSIRIVDGEVGLLQLHENGELTSKVAWGVDDLVIKNILCEDGSDISSFCFNKRRPVLINNYDRNIEFGPNVKSVLALPIKSRATCHGTVIIINKTNGDSFVDEDKIHLEMLVNFAAVAIDNSILLKESLLKQKIEQELTIARQIQETILPDLQSDIEGVEIGTMYRPARYVGGDFYDIIRVNDDGFVLVIGDVSNKGVPAAMLMSAAAAIIRSELMKSPDISPSELMTNLNNVLCNGVIKSHHMFVTLFIARVDMKNRRASYCNAGHLPPFYWKCETEEILELPPGGTFVGQFPDTSFKEGKINISRGDRLLAFTDGVTEAENIHKGQFGVERLKNAFVNDGDLPAHEFCTMVRDWVDRFAEGAGDEPFDDFTLLNIKFLKGDR
ncbi:MAG TPA: GAF domain-containing protein [candidate division Zixibacteria bacterium]|nr:GAF domain-containing protein [candidate division Zixibacteria bacterium]